MGRGGGPLVEPGRSDVLKNRLSELRASRSVSQGALAESLNLSRQTINAIERDRYDPSLPVAFALAQYFDCTIEEIFEPADAPARPRSPRG